MRKVLDFTATDGRDEGKLFVITEMSAAQAEKWAFRAVIALMKSGVEIPDDVANAGMAGIATIGLKALGGVDWNLAEPLIDEMFACIQMRPDRAKPMVLRNLVQDDIEEIQTRLKLRVAVFKLHTDFLQTADKPGSVPAVKATLES